MPRVKIDYIVSFSSEDPEHQASNLLAFDVNKKKWLCSKGEPSCSVVLQLAKAVKICTVHVGAYHSALVEVLVGRSETPNEPFQVLVPSSVFQSPSEARKAEAADRVRSFGADSLAAAARDQRWDRVRLVCSQPYNKHCKYGLSFVHIYSPEGDAPAGPAPPAPARVTPLDMSSDEDEFRPGELFAKHVQEPKDAPTADTGAQIRQATSQALKNIPDSSIKLTKTPITKPSNRRQSRAADDSGAHRQRDGLLYTADDERPHDRIDRVLSRHNHEKGRDDAKTHKHRDKPRDGSHNIDDARRDDGHKTQKSRKDEPSSGESGGPSGRGGCEAASTGRERHPDRKDRAGPPGDGDASRRDEESRKRPHPDNKTETALGAGPASAASPAPLSGVAFVLSGYENPRRANVRSAALALGATCHRDWGPHCTHLICAFPNTPKLRSVRAGPDGGRAVAVRAEWVEQCGRRRRLLPWQWFATEPERRRPPPAAELLSESDTDDEIERVRRNVKKHRTAPPASPPPDRAASPLPDRATPRAASPLPDRATQRAASPLPDRATPRAASPLPDRATQRAASPLPDRATPRAASPLPDRATQRAASPLPDRATPRAASPLPDRATQRAVSPLPADVSTSSDVAFVRDERIQGSVTVVESDSEATDEEPARARREELDRGAALPDFLDGRAFALRAGAGAGASARLIERYVLAYGGLVVDESEAEYILCGPAADARGGRCVSAAWLWRCHRERRLCSLRDYRLA